MVMSPTGQKLQVTVPQGLQPGQRFRIQVGPPQAQAQNFNQNNAYQQQQAAMQQQEQQRQQMIQQQRLAAMQRSQPKIKQTLQIKIPAGVRPGNKITINLPDGRQVQVVVPKGMRPGNTMTINYESSAPPQQQQQQQQSSSMPGTSRVKVVVPQGAVPGQKIRVSFEGYDYDVAVPNGVPPGSKFIAILPTALAMQQQQMRDTMNEQVQRLNAERAMMSQEKELRAQQMIEKSMKSQEEAYAVFQKYDVNHDNSMDPAELLRLLQDSGFPQNVIEDELRTADMDGDHFISFDEFVIYYNHLQERIKMGAATTASQKSELENEMAAMRNALLIQQQQLKERELQIADRNVALAQKEAAMARAEVEGHSGSVHSDDIISVEARVAKTMHDNDVAAQHMAASVQAQKENRKQRLQQQLAAKRAAKANKGAYNNLAAQDARRGSSLGAAGGQVVQASSMI